MNILYFVHGFPPSIGAASINSFKIVEYLAKFGHKILILSPGIFSKTTAFNGSREFSNLGIDVKYSSSIFKLPLNLIFSHYENLIKYIIRYKSNFKPDLILSQYHAYHHASVVGGYLSKILHVPHIIRSHDIFFLTDKFSSPLQLFHSISYSRIYRSIQNCDIFYVTTSEMKDYFLHDNKLKSVNFKIHHNGVDLNQFNANNNQDELKRKYGCDTILLFIGTISRDNDIMNFLNVFPLVLKDHKDTHIVIVGEGPNQNRIIEYIKKIDLSHKIHFLKTKPHDEIPYYVNNSDIGIGRITQEKIWRYMIPVKYLEYMACKKPFITIPCSQDVIKNNDVGLTLKRNFTNKDIIENLNILIDDKNLRRKLGENGYRKIYNEFRWDKIMAKFNQELYEFIENYG